MVSVVVIGGGVSGLVAAGRLSARGASVTVFEADGSVGGRVRSREVDGFTLDRGFQVLFPAYPAVQTELDTTGLDLRYFSPGATIARPDHRSTIADPFGDPFSTVDTLLNRDLTLRDKIRVVGLRRELRRASADGFRGRNESIRSFLTRRGFSARFIEHFAEPFYGGITLDRSLATDAGVFAFTFGRLAAGGSAVPAAGMGAIADQLARRAREAGATLETNTTVEAVRPGDDGVGADDPGSPAVGVTVDTDGETVSADAAIVATPPRVARDLTGVEAIPTAGRGCVTQYFATRRHRSLDTGKKLLLNAASDRPNHVAVLSSVAPAYAPDGRTLLSATTLGSPSASDAELANDTREALAAWYPEHRFDELELLATDRIEFAQFAQPPGFHDALPDVRDPPGAVYLAGECTRWSSIQGAMASGQDAARAVRVDLEAG